jgi:hypothetical protein
MATFTNYPITKQTSLGDLVGNLSNMQQFQQQQALEQQRAENARVAAEEEWTRNEESKQRDRENILNKERINALGRASDKQSNELGFAQINKQADMAMRQNELSFKNEESIRSYNQEGKKIDQEMALKMEKLKLEARKLEEKVIDRRSKEYVAEINKN